MAFGTFPFGEPADLLIVGASARAAAQSAARAGLSVVAADRFADQDLVALCPTLRLADYGELVALIGRVRLAREWIFTGAVENRPQIIGQMACHLPLLGNDTAAVRGARDPWRVRQCLAERGLPAPAIASSLPRAASSVRSPAWLLKSLTSCGGSGVCPAAAHPYAARPGRYFQQRVRGTPHAAAFVAAQDRCRLLGVTRQLVGQAWAGTAGYHYCGSLGPLALSAGQAAAWQRIGQALAEQIHLTGLFGVDAVVDERSVWPVEVNPRYTASMELLDRALGISTVGIHRRACGWGELPERLPSASGVHGKAVLYAPRAFRVSEPLAALMHHPPGRVTAADLPAAGTWIAAGQPIVTLLVADRDPRSALAHLRTAAREILRTASC